MFQFSRFASAHYVFTCRSARKQGFSHSEIIGSKPIRGAPTHIAAYHVLRRLSVPRHSPNALKSLDYSHYCCPPRNRLDTSFGNERLCNSFFEVHSYPRDAKRRLKSNALLFFATLTSLRTRIATEKLIVLRFVILLFAFTRASPPSDVGSESF